MNQKYFHESTKQQNLSFQPRECYHPGLEVECGFLSYGILLQYEQSAELKTEFLVYLKQIWD